MVIGTYVRCKRNRYVSQSTWSRRRQVGQSAWDQQVLPCMWLCHRGFFRARQTLISDHQLLHNISSNTDVSSKPKNRHNPFWVWCSSFSLWPQNFCFSPNFSDHQCISSPGVCALAQVKSDLCTRGKIPPINQLFRCYLANCLIDAPILPF